MENQKKSPITIDATGGKIFSVVGDTYRILVGGAESNGAFAAIDMLVPPGGGPGPHKHAQIEESFYVIEGEIEVKSEFGEYIAKKGSFVNIPKGGVVHSFKNKTDQIAHLLCMVVPSGLDTFFEEIGKPVGYGEFLPPPPMDPESVKKLQSIAEKHGQKVYPPEYLDNIK
ncbi:cupin domain-containing protein [Mucilaginibacter lappiensis]|uniref:Quercetin dioxygenase-like cupin family protein n=1 Tax=Mucilaginibacter lappiensis TaxID=354630 RepID=A0A841JK04_9SPHI|nr:cupin domain-containing protein [Mucilaginibacter lappiensis]MBB6130612.1 quercetin dioxygenase-like cupin family protein [Mucilaginibacter lappiensis]